ncbi:ShlB/FhaC/HecB family hemolysin secretion/activation protein [Rosistilla oblonga]|uniref:ShlB/FhaC/HecB family hemolysin secretion/activation protein n=1 Tax=Rosistilla oblonga TaxID=2527990 RepID=UPI003A9807B3
MDARHTTLRFIVAATLLFSIGKVGTAQNFERYKPLSLDARPLDARLPEPKDLPEKGSDEVLVASLDALIVLDDPSKVDTHNAFPDATGISIDFESQRSLVHDSGIRSILESHLHQPITLRKLNQLSREIILFYRRCGQPIVDVQIPEQKITAGTVQIVVIESRIGKIWVSGSRFSDAQRLRDQVRYNQVGSRIHESRLEEDLYWLNRSPFRHVDLALDAGEQDGTTDVRFQVTDVLPVRAYAGYEDTGVRTLGLERLYAGLILGNPFGYDGTLGYQYTSDLNFSALHAHAASYNVDFNRDYSLLTYGSWSSVAPSLPPPLDQSGEGWQTGIYLSRFFQRTSMREQAFSIGLDFKSTNNNLEFGGTNVQNSLADLVQINVGYDRLLRARNDNYLIVNHDLYIGPGSGFTSHSSAADFNTIRANTDPSYVYYRGHINGCYELPRNLEFRGGLTGQISSDRLLFSETLGLGGYDTIRGYDQRTLNGDGGWIANLELGFQPWIKRTSRGTSVLRSFVFADLGEAYTRSPVPGEIGDQFISSAGVGMRYAISNRVNLRLDYGHGFNDVPGTQKQDRIHLGLVSLFGPVPR